MSLNRNPIPLVVLSIFFLELPDEMFKSERRKSENPRPGSLERMSDHVRDRTELFKMPFSLLDAVTLYSRRNKVSETHYLVAP